MNANDKGVLAVMADTRFGRREIGTVRYENGGAGEGYRYFPSSATTWPSRRVHPTPEAAIKGRVPKGTTLEARP